MRGLVPRELMPRSTPETQPFWDGCCEGRLLISRCAGCEHRHFSREAACPVCGSTSLEWEGATGRGRLYSYAIPYSPSPGQDSQEGIPGIIANIQLDEGPRLMSPLVGLEGGLDGLEVGMPVEVVFYSPGDTGGCAFGFRPVSRPT